MNLSVMQTPEIDRPGMRTEEKLRLVLEYMLTLEKQMRYVLSNLDGGNLGAELSREIEAVSSAGEKIEHAISDEAFESYARQTARSIEARVEKNGVVAAVNMSPEEIKIEAARLALEGLTTINGYFKVLLDGSFEATAGRIAGWSIDEGALYDGENTDAASPEAYMGRGTLKKPVSIAGSAERTDWRAILGPQFGVTEDGALYAGSGVFRGKVSAGQILSGEGESGDNGKLEGGALTDHSVGETQMEVAYAEMKQLIAGAGWKTVTIDGESMKVLTA